jgi:hypothetical protein
VDLEQEEEKIKEKEKEEDETFKKEMEKKLQKIDADRASGLSEDYLNEMMGKLKLESVAHEKNVGMRGEKKKKKRKEEREKSLRFQTWLGQLAGGLPSSSNNNNKDEKGKSTEIVVYNPVVAYAQSADYKDLNFTVNPLAKPPSKQLWKEDKKNVLRERDGSTVTGPFRTDLNASDSVTNRNGVFLRNDVVTEYASEYLTEEQFQDLLKRGQFQ